ncbi:hypothetical protein AOC05_04580 [Arthrobacter alpinus]|uniref:CobQ/CobB/MinD/ParA nucleotide binding domain-containing protein n=1 Tax=Arthrobacter alpinus TaxID=656366 RepID=A0A0M3UFQ9_9MICC|nr:MULTISPECIES: MinD/ParA family protein [Arthrobacter]ALE91765.1 hypothetical protein AOC05_04580 [Arthrobacter alpinus]
MAQKTSKTNSPTKGEGVDAEPATAVTTAEENEAENTAKTAAANAAADNVQAPASEELVVVLPVADVSTDPAFTGAVQAVSQVEMPTHTAGPRPEPAAAAPIVSVATVSVPNTPAAPVSAPSVPAADQAGTPDFVAWEPAEQPGTQGGSPRRQRSDGPEPAAALTSDRLLTKVAAPPVSGWRRLLYQITFGALNVGDSDKVRLERSQDSLIASRLGDHTRYVPVLSRKGGVGKTTVTTLLGMVLADTREDRVIAMDANPDRGTLSDRSPGSADFTARNLVRDRFSVSTFSQLSDYVARDGSRLDVLASDTDPTVAQAFDDSDYRAVTDILSKFYSIVLTDSGTGMVHSVMKGTLEKADTVVLVSGGSVDEARLASETLSWLEAHGRHDLVANAIVVINMSGGETQVDITQIEDHFKSRVRNVLRIPYDKHLAEGSRVELAKLRPATRVAVKELAALVVTELLKD